MTIHITSPQNPRIKELIHLRESKRDRYTGQKILVEGRDEIRLALAAGYSPLSLFLAPELGASFQDLGLPPVTETFTVSEAVFAKLSYREHPDGYLGVFPLPQRSPNELNEKKLTFVLVIEGIEKPGNLGAILRSADAAGIEAVLICDPRVDLWNPNVIRASRGTIFSVPLYPLSDDEALPLLRQHNLRLYAATPEGHCLYTSLDLTHPLAWIVGSEDKGLSPFWKKACDAQVAIPMFGRINSLNVSVATAILLFETVRQRMERTG